MPRKPRRPCSYPGCPLLTEERYCPEHQREITARYNREGRSPESRKAYGRTWRRIRDRVLAEQPLCQKCLEAGRYTPATEVHHIIPLSCGGTHDRDNLMPLCKRCHSEITAREGGRWG